MPTPNAPFVFTTHANNVECISCVARQNTDEWNKDERKKDERNKYEKDDRHLRDRPEDERASDERYDKMVGPKLIRSSLFGRRTLALRLSLVD